MDLAVTATVASAGAKSPLSEPACTETPTRIQPIKPFPSSNGVLKRHHPHNQHHSQQSVPVIYKECLKNHAASLGGHAVDGCGEFIPSPSATSADPTSLKCDACGCHRNFHRREPEEPALLPIPATHVIEYQPHHRHHPPPPHQPLQAPNRSPNSASPPPISSTYFPSAPHMLLALSSGLSPPAENVAPHMQGVISPNSNMRKRFRTKFTQEQKDKMYEFAERVGWKVQKVDDELIQNFCSDVGVDRGVLKVWMHNNKNTLGRKDDHTSRNILGHEHEHIVTHNIGTNGITTIHNNREMDSCLEPNHHKNRRGASVAANGSSSSS